MLAAWDGNDARARVESDELSSDQSLSSLLALPVSHRIGSEARNLRRWRLRSRRD